MYLCRYEYERNQLYNLIQYCNDTLFVVRESFYNLIHTKSHPAKKDGFFHIPEYATAASRNPHTYPSCPGNLCQNAYKWASLSTNRKGACYYWYNPL